MTVHPLLGELHWLTACMTPMGTPLGVFSSTTVAGSATGGPGAKTGEACAMSVLGLVAIGDAGIVAAARKGGIANVKTGGSLRDIIVARVPVCACPPLGRTPSVFLLLAPRRHADI